MEKLQELIKEWYSEPEIHESYPDGLSQFLSESSDSHNDAYYLIAELLRQNMEMKEALGKIVGIEVWISDVKMKEHFQNTVYDCLTSCNKGKE